MLSGVFQENTYLKADTPREGELYKILNVSGTIFRLLYGFYEDYEKNDPSAEPMPIYPDFLKEPLYTDSGHPFVTKMQDACVHYKGAVSDACECAECYHYRHGAELIGICACPMNMKISTIGSGD